MIVHVPAAEHKKLGSVVQLLIVLLLGIGRLAPPSFAADPIHFEEVIAPIMRQNCVACHHSKKAEGGLSLESFAALSRGGDSGSIIDLKTIDKSLLLDRITGRVEPIMPPIDNAVDAKPLTADQVSIVKRWIENGAISKASPSIVANDFQPLPIHVQASYAMTMTPDGEWLAYARGNDLHFHPISNWSDLAATAPRQSIQQDAHRDICFALAASPDGQRIASGSSGEVKLWRRKDARPLLPAATSQPASSELAAGSEIHKKSETTPEISGQGSLNSSFTSDQAGGEGSAHLQFNGSPIHQFVASMDSRLLATLDEQHRLRLWQGPTAKLVQGPTTDRVSILKGRQLERDTDRQKRRIDRWTAKIVELQAVVEKESKGVETAKQSQETCKNEWESKRQELQTILVDIADLEKSMAPIQAAVEAARQQSVDLTERQKQENADVAKLQLAIAGTQALIDLGNQKIAEWTSKLEPKKKSASDLQSQESAARTKFESAQKALHQNEESLRLAVAAVQQKQSQLAPEPALFEHLQSESERLKKANMDLAISAVAMAFTGSGNRLVSINGQNQLEIFSTKPWQRIASPIPLEDTIHSIVPIGDGEILLNGKDSVVQRWSIETLWELECTLGTELPGIISDRVNALAFNHDGSKLAIGSGTVSRSGHLTILELGAPQALNLTSQAVHIDWSEPELHSDTILGLAYSPDGRALASCSADKMTKVIDLETLKPIRNFEGHTHHVLGVAWHDDGFNLATTSADGTAKIWDLETGESTRTLTIGKELTALSFVGNSNRFVSAVIDHTVRMHDITSNDQIRQFSAAQNALYATIVSPDGRFAIAIGQEGIPRAWQIDDGKLVAEIKAP